MTRSLSPRAVALVASASLAFVHVGCDSDGGARPLGAVCEQPAQCESGLCSNQLCIDPSSCVDALAGTDDQTFSDACAASLGELTLTPNPAEVEPDGEVQFTLTATLASTTTGGGRIGEGDAQPRPDDGADEGGGSSQDPEFEGGALEGPVDVTRAATFSASDPEAVSFDEATPGLALIQGEGRFTVTATIGSGDLVHTATADVIVGASLDGSDQGEGDGGDPR